MTPFQFTNLGLRLGSRYTARQAQAFEKSRQGRCRRWGLSRGPPRPPLGSSISPQDSA